jgi:hypothetical protein
VLDSDTDLAYPPDLKRFLNYVGETVHARIAYSSGQDGTARRSRPYDLVRFGAERTRGMRIRSRLQRHSQAAYRTGLLNGRSGVSNPVLIDTRILRIEYMS